MKNNNEKKGNALELFTMDFVGIFKSTFLFFAFIRVKALKKSVYW
jgi:hypothetical protein